MACLLSVEILQRTTETHTPLLPRKKSFKHWAIKNKLTVAKKIPAGKKNNENCRQNLKYSSYNKPYASN